MAGGISGKAATALVDRLGKARTGGTYLDRESQRLVVAVTDDAAAQEVREAGGIARVVRYSTSQLDAITTTLNESISLPGSYWGTNSVDNQIEVRVSSAVSDTDYAKVQAIAARFGSAMDVGRFQGKLQKDLSGGRYIKSDDGGTCSSGFNVRDKSNPDSLYFLTAGHCTKGIVDNDWRDANATYLGYDVGAFYPERDHGLIRHYNANVSKPGNVYLHNGEYQDIVYSRDASVNEPVCHSGYASGYQCGYVTQTGITANYGDGNVYNLVATSYCREGGDSGGPVFWRDAAIGIHSGGHDCVGFYQRVNPALSWYGMEVY
ncbi:S1 family peptidase [Micromonospora sp. NPDC047738]|uniref:S1 family peptidase n=1 Tax=Micromonospora sp. NPDC047738 TaxID=3155741 RepID=UPI0033CF4C72